MAAAGREQEWSHTTPPLDVKGRATTSAIAYHMRIARVQQAHSTGVGGTIADPTGAPNAAERWRTAMHTLVHHHLNFPGAWSLDGPHEQKAGTSMNLRGIRLPSQEMTPIVTPAPMNKDE